MNGGASQRMLVCCAAVLRFVERLAALGQRPRQRAPRSGGLPDRWLALGIVFLYLYPFPFFAGLSNANEKPRVYLTRAIVEEGTFAIDEGVRRWGTTVDVSPSGGHHYSNKAPGSSFLAVPAYLLLRGVKALAGAGEPTLAELFWAFRVGASILPALLFLWLYARFLARQIADPDARRLALVSYALGSMAMTYSILFIAHQLSAVCAATAYIATAAVVEGRRRARWMGIAGLAAGSALLVDYQAVFATLPVALYALWHFLGVRPRRPAGLFWGLAGALPPVALLLFYHARAFGSPWRTGYDASVTFAHYHQHGFLGLTGPTWEAFVGSTVAPDNGLFWMCPVLLLMIPGWLEMARQRQRWQLFVTAAVVAIYLAFISSITFWRGGWQMGPRYITAMLPFAMIPVAAAMAWAGRRRWAWAVCVALSLVGIAIYALSCVEYPHFPEKFTNPVHEITFRLLAQGHAAYNAGWLVGLRGLASLVPYVLVLALVVAPACAPSPARRWPALAGAAAALLILGLYGLAPGGGPAADVAYVRWVAGLMPH